MTEETRNNEEYGLEKKEIIFRETPKRHAELKIQLQYEGLKMSKFLRECVSLFLSKDPDMMVLIDKMKGITKPPISKRDINTVRQERKEEKAVEVAFALDENEVENIFDLIEEEHPDI